jgi:hypothetical protein
LKGEVNMKVETFRLLADVHKRDGYGRNVAISNGIIVVAAHARGTTNKGAVDLYDKKLGYWSKFKEITASDGQVDDQFGTSVAIDGDILVVGAQGDDDAAELAGAVYIFERNFGGPDNWGEVAKLTPANPLVRDTLGGALAVEDTTVVAGTSRPHSTDRVPGFVDVSELQVGATNEEIQALADKLFNMANNITSWKLTSTSSLATAARDNHYDQGKRQARKIAEVILT